MSNADFRVRARLYNNHLLKAREALGYMSTLAASRALNIPYTMLLDYENLRRKPIYSASRRWTPMALRIAAAYKKLPEDLWPEVTHDVLTNYIEHEMSFPMLEFKAPDEAAYLSERRDEIEQIMAEAFTDKERDVIERRFGLVSGTEEMLKEIGDEYGVTPERVRQIEAWALRKLRLSMKDDE